MFYVLKFYILFDRMYANSVEICIEFFYRNNEMLISSIAGVSGFFVLLYKMLISPIGGFYEPKPCSGAWESGEVIVMICKKREVCTVVHFAVSLVRGCYHAQGYLVRAPSQ